jgi:hypothetical protein
MPYIITTTHDREPDWPGEQTRRAVATLEEAREAAKDALPASANLSRHFEAEDLPESGGTIGPLPAGTVIAVRLCGWSELHRAATGQGLDFLTGLDHSTQHAAIIDAYNARQGATVPR